MQPCTDTDNVVELLGIGVVQMLAYSFSACSPYSTVNVSNYPHIILNAIAKAKCFKMLVWLKLKDTVLLFRIEGMLKK